MPPSVEEQTVATVGLDIGSNRIRTAVVGLTGRGVTSLIAYGSVASQGIQQGVITDSRKAAEAIRASLHQASAMLGDSGTVRVAVVGIGSPDMLAYPTDAVLERTQRKRAEVTYDDVRNLRKNHHQVFFAHEYQQLELLPMGYSLDNGEWIAQPIGHKAGRIAARYLAVAARKTTIDIVTSTCKQAGISIKSLVYSPVASDRVLLDPDEMNDGVIVIDLGSETTNVLYAKEGIWQHAFPLPVGARHLVSDIAAVLEMPFDEAKKLYRDHGIRRPSRTWDEEGKPVAPQVIAHGNKEIDPEYLYRIIEARMEEIYETAFRSLYEVAGVVANDPVVLVGGGALMHGITEYSENLLKRSVRIGFPRGIDALEGESASPEAVNVLGLAKFGFEVAELPEGGVFGKLFGWVNGA